MGRAAPSSSPSSPQLGRKRTAAPTLEPPTPRRYCSMDDVMRRARAVDAPPPVARAPVYTYYENLICETCGSGDCDDDLLLCDRCDRGHHTFCLRPIAAKVPIGPWFCPVCAPPAKAPKRFPMKQTKIIDFFGIQKDGQDAQAPKCRLSQDARRRRKRSLVMHKKRRRILPFVPSEDGARRLKQMASLATALTSSKTEFSNELTYMPNMAPRSSNMARLEVGGMQVLPKEDKETIELCRTMQKRGECPPLLVVFDSLEGFTVQADGDIKDMTFLAEYAGDVDYLEKRANDDIDCIMTLLLTADPSQRLVICPDKRGNISRFISGINNHTQDGKKKQNVKCVRYDIDGESHVMLVACRDIACGEKLYYDYNGYEHAYPTQHFL
ncbi:probable Histone-lysine N-methyltransferase ATXR5 isoform X1 [Miscanthus floridulus]|uniref:probable Histone-lysine N-methyltransferase ATXR5 isoform X1 n=1 Tax=Miscanthus floridulus TaxID=154761 RepID=UPI003457B8C0